MYLLEYYCSDLRVRIALVYSCSMLHVVCELVNLLFECQHQNYFNKCQILYDSVVLLLEHDSKDKVNTSLLNATFHIYFL